MTAPASADAPSLASAPDLWRQSPARVVRQLDYGAGHFWLDLEIDQDWETPEPGQFVQLLLPLPSPVLLPRPMSVSAARRLGARLRLGFLYQAVGSGTKALAALGPGSPVGALGPLGRGYPLGSRGTPVLLAGGRGVAPLLFAADWLAHRGQPCTFLFGARTRELLVGLADARQRVRRNRSRLQVATDDGSAGHRGTVVGLLDRLSSKLRPPLVLHACGPHAMLKAVASWAMRRGVPAYLAMESVMACGTGVCRGCPLPRSQAGRARYLRETGDAPSLLGNVEFAMTCTEGPVFEAAELDWEQIA